MAERRMFSKRIINSARFLKMPVSTQCLYFHLGLHADDDGIVEAFTVMNSIGATEDDLRILAAKGFVIVLNEDLVSYIADWKENNKIRADRKVDSIYKDLLIQMLPDVKLQEKKQRADTVKKVLLQGNTEDGQPMDVQWTTNGQPMDGIGKDRIGKDRIGKDRLDILSVSDENEPCESTPRAEEITEIVDYLNARVGTKYRPNSKETKKHINARLEEGFTVEQFKEVIDKKANQWIGTEMEQYLRPSTLFGTKFESYLNAYVNPIQAKPNNTKEKVTFADLLKGGLENE